MIIGPTSKFTDLGIGPKRWLVAETFAPLQSQLNEQAKGLLSAGRYGLRMMPQELDGVCLLLPSLGGDLELHRTFLYTLAETDEVERVVRLHIEHIAREHGPGDVWFLDEPVHYIRDNDSTRIVLQSTELHPHREFALLRTMYGHEKQARLRAKPDDNATSVPPTTPTPG